MTEDHLEQEALGWWPMSATRIATARTSPRTPRPRNAPTSLALGELPATYDKAINSVQTSFYDPALAAKAKLRVEV